MNALTLTRRPLKAHNKNPLWLLFFAGLFFIGMYIAYALGFRLNTTHSIPIGVYRVSGKEAIKGDYVIFCPPVRGDFTDALERGYIVSGFCEGGYGNMMKELAGVAGDSVEISRNGVSVNGVLLPHSKPLEKDGLGRILTPHYIFKRHLRNGEVLLMTNRLDNSFDARYFGILNINQLDAVIVPVWVW